MRVPLLCAVLALVACGEVAPAAPDRPSLDPIASTPRPRSLCDDETIVRLLSAYDETLAACGAHLVEGTYAAAHTTVGLVVAYELVDSRDAAADGPVHHLGGLLVDGDLTCDPPERWIPSTPADREAILAVAVLRSAGTRHVVFDETELSGAVRRWLETPLGSREDDAGMHLSAYADAVDHGMDGAHGETVRIDAALAPDGTLTVSRTALSHAHGDATTVPWLEGRPALAPSSTPRPVCGSPDEAEIRARVPGLDTSCDALDARYVAGATSEGPLLAVAWTDHDGDRVFPRRAVIVGSELHWHPYGYVLVPADDDLELLAYASVFVAHGGPAIAFAAADLERVVPPDALPFARDVTLGPVPDATGLHLVAVGLERSASSWELRRYEARGAPGRPFEVARTVLASSDGRARTVPGLDALPPLARTARPRRLCRDHDEAAVRARVAELPPCRRLDAWFVAADADADLLAVVWRSADDPTRHAIVVRGDRLSTHLDRDVEPATPEDAEAVLVLAILAAHGGPELAFDAATTRAVLDGEPMPEITFGLVVDPETENDAGGTRRLSALGRRSEGDRSELVRYHATLDLYGYVRVYRIGADGAQVLVADPHH